MRQVQLKRFPGYAFLNTGWQCHLLAVNFDHLPSTTYIPLPHPLYYPHLVQHYVNYWDPRIRVLLPCRV